MRTKRTREDPLNKYHLSLDTPLDENEDGSFTIADILPDERAEAEFEDIEQRDFQQAVQAALAQSYLTIMRSLPSSLPLV